MLVPVYEASFIPSKIPEFVTVLNKDNNTYTFEINLNHPLMSKFSDANGSIERFLEYKFGFKDVYHLGYRGMINIP